MAEPNKVSDNHGANVGTTFRSDKPISKLGQCPVRSSQFSVLSSNTTQYRGTDPLSVPCPALGSREQQQRDGPLSGVSNRGTDPLSQMSISSLDGIRGATEFTNKRTAVG